MFKLYGKGRSSEINKSALHRYIKIFLSCFIILVLFLDAELSEAKRSKNRPVSQAGDFITVIEVNGLKAVENALKKAEESSQSSESSATDSNLAAKKKVPPK